ncbi:MAG: hypothetical protein RR063_06900, partial [Anaerovoracaceae bacterium]
MAQLLRPKLSKVAKQSPPWHSICADVPPQLDIGTAFAPENSVVATVFALQLLALGQGCCQLLRQKIRKSENQKN